MITIILFLILIFTIVKSAGVFKRKEYLYCPDCHTGMPAPDMIYYGGLPFTFCCYKCQHTIEHA